MPPSRGTPASSPRTTRKSKAAEAAPLEDKENDDANQLIAVDTTPTRNAKNRRSSRLSNSKGNQPSITDMFAKKRTRSPDTEGSVALEKKIKIEETKDCSAEKLECKDKTHECNLEMDVETNGVSSENKIDIEDRKHLKTEEQDNVKIDISTDNNNQENQKDDTSEIYGEMKDEISQKHGDVKDKTFQHNGDTKDDYTQQNGDTKYDTPQQIGDTKDDNSQQIGDTKDDYTQQNGDTKVDTPQQIGDTKDDNTQQIKDIIDDTPQQIGDIKDATPQENGNLKHELSTDKQTEVNTSDVNNDRCPSCRQFIDNSNLIFFQGHPQDAVEEYIALTNDKLVLSAGDEGDITERPQCNATGFSIFDKQGHMCQLDSGLIEADVRLYLSGYLKSIWSESPDIDEESVPVKDVGPIIEWFIHGFDGGKKNCITVSTEFGEYNLMAPSTEYAPLLNNLYEKVWISKVVVEYLEEYNYLDPTYEDLLEIVRESTIPELNDMQMTEDMLHKHAQFICDQVVSLQSDDDEEPPLITLPCMRELIKLIGIKFGKRAPRSKIEFKKKKKSEKPSWTKATTTPLVRKTFETFFSNQLDNTDKNLILRRKRCGVCEQCQLPDCGECTACKAMAKFGGSGKSKKACIRRLCPNMAVEEANDDNPEDEEDYGDMEKQEKMEETVPVKFAAAGTKEISWIGKPIKTENNRIYYEKVKIDNMEVTGGDYVMVETSSPKLPPLVTRVGYIWKDPARPKSGFFHGQVFIRATDTILGEVGDPREIFLADRCCNGAPLSSILRFASVEKRDIPKGWFNLGGKEVSDEQYEDDGKTFFFQKFYQKFIARFEDLPTDPHCPNDFRKHRYCPSCERQMKRDNREIPKVFDKMPEKSAIVPEENRTEWSKVCWRDFDYKKGCGVFLEPGTFKMKNNLNNGKNTRPKLEKVDESIYTEYYRKPDNNLRGSNIDTVEPFCVGYIAAVTATGNGPLISPQNIYLKVHIMYRPENTCSKYPQHEDVNLVYWSDEIKEVPFTAVTGPCFLVYEKNIPDQESPKQWLQQDPNRFYFKEAYNKKTNSIISVPNEACSVGEFEKPKDKGKGKGKHSKVEHAPTAVPIYMQNVIVRPLKTLDVFAGCGGLSEGLHQAGIADCKWAIENMEAAAHAYSLNNPNCTVFNEDCNELLKDAMAGATHSKRGYRLPMQGEVELLCGGPPCQGFSGMNRFNSREYSNFKNSLVASYLSYCDYYRPKYFILENVRNFVAYKKGMVLKLCLRTLLDMGYQCTFGIVQAGNYGVPQTRRRLIILASAPGYNLPLYPEPTHVFSRRACTLTAAIDGKRYSSNINWVDSAPRRTCTIHDAMSDLPHIGNGANKLEIDYGSMPESHFQRMIRSKDESARLRDHICKNMAALIQARICRVPTTIGSDWRDLPNISVTLSDGNKSKVLQYRHHDKKNGRSASGALRGVCACAAGGVCDSVDKQEGTLIPWCLPHTGNRHNHWAGLYGRISWDGYFSTTVTDPEPMGKQGRVLHPEQNRVVSVRECARSQGFPDTYMFAGSIMDKHRQVGNAVPPPLGAALGREIKKALAARA